MRGQRTPIVVAIAAALWLVASVLAQRTGSSSLVVNVAPEAHLSPSQIPLRFIVTADGAGDVTTQAASIAAWVRALPRQQIHLMARIDAVAGPGPAPAIVWSGSVSRSTGGAQSAACTAGSFASGPSQEMVSGWQLSGTLTCAVTFSLENPQSLAPGVYSTTISLALQAQ